MTNRAQRRAEKSYSHGLPPRPFPCQHDQMVAPLWIFLEASQSAGLGLEGMLYPMRAEFGPDVLVGMCSTCRAIAVFR